MIKSGVIKLETGCLWNSLGHLSTEKMKKKVYFLQENTFSQGIWEDP